MITESFHEQAALEIARLEKLIAANTSKNKDAKPSAERLRLEKALISFKAACNKTSGGTRY